MKKSILFKYVSLCSVFFLISVIAAYAFYLNEEAKSTYGRKAICEMAAMGDLLNSGYQKSLSYPEKKDFVAFLLNDIETIKCGKEVTIVGGSLVDPWGDEYCYVKKSNTLSYLYSFNESVDSKYSSSMEVFELNKGNTKLLDLPRKKGRLCGDL